jgi:hypothetical protein
MAIVSFRQDEIPAISESRKAEVRAQGIRLPSEADLKEIPETTEEELARMVPWRAKGSRRMATLLPSNAFIHKAQ